MSLFILNKDKCRKDGICIEICPRHIISSDDKTRFPLIDKEKEELCIKCGHCVAVCPYGAISLEDMPAGSCEGLNAGWKLDPARIEQFLKGRRSIRTYLDKPVPTEALERLIDIARYAPSGINRHPVNWAVLDTSQKVRKLSGLTVEWMRALVKEGSQLASSFNFEGMVRSWDKGYDNVLRNAPSLIIAYGLKGDLMARDDSVIALTYADLAAIPLGLGGCWAGYATMAINMSPEARKFIGLSGRADCFGALMLGFPKYEFKRIPQRDKPRIKRVH